MNSGPPMFCRRRYSQMAWLIAERGIHESHVERTAAMTGGAEGNPLRGDRRVGRSL